MITVDIWDQLLHCYVDEQGRVDYAAWKAEAQGDLVHWLENLQTLLPGNLTLEDAPEDVLENAAANDRLALWLNLYNALTIAQVLRVYPIASIRPTWLGVPNWIAFLRFFTRPVYTLNDRQLSLNTIEHKILRQQFRDPRIHFALVCASIGCPLLRNEAYHPDRVEAQLEDDAARFINNPEKVRFEPQTQTLYCSKIFRWYRSDFLTAASSVPVYIQRYLVAPASLTDTTTVRYLAYDWHLNGLVRELGKSAAGRLSSH